MRKHIRLISPTVEGTRRDPAILRSFERPDLEISRVKITRGPASIESSYDDMLAVPDTVARIVEAERVGVHAVIIDCMGDPGLHPAREAVSIPVLGPAETAMHVAAMLGHRFSVVTVLDRCRPLIENQAKIYGVAEKLASVRAVDLPVLELEADAERLRRVMIEQATKAVAEDGADTIIFGCTGMFGWAETVRNGLLAAGHDVPVIDPVPTAIQVAAGLVEVKLSHSKSAYPMPPVKNISGYEFLADAGRLDAAE